MQIQHTFSLPIMVLGHVHIVDDLGNVLLDETNAIHPQNMARIFARALAREDNYYIHRMAFGNGGTLVDAAYNITYKTPNDGQSPDVATWNSRLYNETYSEVIDVFSLQFKQDPGSADSQTGVRTGGGAVPSGDPASVPHVSGPGVVSRELGLISGVVITCTLNSGEPTSQAALDDPSAFTVTDFIFDEIGLYTLGGPAINTNGYQYVDVGNKTSIDDTKLVAGQTYSFNITIDSGTLQTITFTVPVGGGSGVPGAFVTYGDLCEAVNTADPTWNFTSGTPAAVLSITAAPSGSYPSIAGAQTFGFLKFESQTLGPGSTIDLTGPQTTTFLGALNSNPGSSLVASVVGSAAGVQNAPTSSSTERERLLTHVIFSPVLKAANRTITVTYTLIVSVARTE